MFFPCLNYYLLAIIWSHYYTLCTYALNSSSAQFDHLEWLLNGTVYKTGMVQNTNLQLLIQPIIFSHAGLWECRAVFSDNTASSRVNAGILTVFGKYYIELLYNVWPEYSCAVKHVLIIDA